MQPIDIELPQVGGRRCYLNMEAANRQIDSLNGPGFESRLTHYFCFSLRVDRRDGVGPQNLGPIDRSTADGEHWAPRIDLASSSMDTGRFLQRNLRPDAPAGGGGLERVVTSTDGATDTEISMFLSALLAYLPCNRPRIWTRCYLRIKRAVFFLPSHFRILEGVRHFTISVLAIFFSTFFPQDTNLDSSDHPPSGSGEEITTVDTFSSGCPFPRLMELPDDVWLHLADADTSLAMHCTLSAINRRLRDLMGLVTRLCWPEGVPRTDCRGSELRAATIPPWPGAVQPPLRAIIGRCAGSLRFLSICADEETLRELPPMPNLRTLFLMADVVTPIVILLRCPNLAVLGLPHFSTKEPVDFASKLEAACPRLRHLYCQLTDMGCFGLAGCTPAGAQITEVESADVDESVKVTIGGGDPTGAWAGREEGRQSLFLPARVRRLALQCHPAGVPALLGHLPNLTHLELIPSTSQTPDGMAAFMRSLAQACPRLTELHLGPNVALTTPEDLAQVGPALVSLTARLVGTAGSLIALPTPRLRQCDLQLRTDLSVITLELPQVQELSLSVPASLARLTLRCPWLRSVSITIRAPSSGASVPPECGQPPPLCLDCQAHLPLSLIELRSPLAPDMGIYESCCAPLVAASTGSVDVRLELPQVTLRGTGLFEDLPPSVRRLWLGLKAAKDLRLAPTVTHLALAQANCPETRLSGPGLRTLELGGSATRSPRTLELDTPLLDELVVAEGFPAVTFASQAAIRRVAALRPNGKDEVGALFAFLRGPAGQTLSELSFRSPGILDPPPIIELAALRSLHIVTPPPEPAKSTPSTHALLICPAMERLACGGHVWIQSECPFLSSLGQKAPLPYQVQPSGQLRGVPPLPGGAGPLPLPTEPKIRTENDAMTVLLASSGDCVSLRRDESSIVPSTGPAIRTVILEDVTPPNCSVSHLVAYRPDVLLLECPSTSDTLILRSPQTPRLRPLLASDLVAIFVQAGFAPLAVLHRLPIVAPGCLPPDIFLRSLWAALRDCRRLVGHFQEAQTLDQYLRALGRSDRSRPGAALAALTQSGMKPEQAKWLGYAGHQPQPTNDCTTDLVRATRTLQAHFPGIRLDALADAVRLRGSEFRCAWPHYPPSFRLEWACQECSPLAGMMRQFEPALVLPDPESRLTCLPILQRAATLTLADVSLPRFSGSCGLPCFCVRCLLRGRSEVPSALPVAYCAECRTTELVIRDDVDCPALPPFDEGPPQPQPDEAPSSLCPQTHPMSMPPPLRVLVVTSGPKGAQRAGGENGMRKPAERRELRVDPAWGNLSTATVLLNEPSPVPLQGLPSSPTNPLRMGVPAIVNGVGSSLRWLLTSCAAMIAIAAVTCCAFVCAAALAAGQPDVLVFMNNICAAGYERQDLLSALSPQDLLRCIERAYPIRLPRLVAVLGLPHAVDTGRFLQRNLRPDAPAGGGGLERVVASTDGATETEVSMFLSALLAYLPCNPLEDLDEVLEVACRQADNNNNAQPQRRHLRVLIRVAPCGSAPADSVD
ncbi:hypothetical protein PAPYR_10272 [Paratrimastix pyriformis]|uniref:F-box domain-containing protein n=1 Tax=Paratrimastix pyriformis TaxID=342808 RepID=A0ABQ8UA71_9EUKA|nr:hypothetical protein PAPYR_10272 [Paratrimastix pyriformis]